VAHPDVRADFPVSIRFARQEAPDAAKYWQFRAATH
jgi:hypothetical protein